MLYSILQFTHAHIDENELYKLIFTSVYVVYMFFSFIENFTYYTITY